MPKLILEVAFAATLTFAAIVSLIAGAQASELMIGSATARASATPAAKAGGVYFTLMNHGAGADRLLSVTTEVAGRAELHESAVQEGVATMRRLDAIDLAPGSMVSLAPGGIHLMLFDLKAPLRKGERFPMTLTFEKAGEMTVEVNVGDVAAGMDHAMPEVSGN